MSTVIEHKSVDGRATLTDTHLVFDYNLLGRVGRRTKRSEIPLEKITAYDIISGAITYLRVAATGWSATPDPSKSALAFALHPRTPHDDFVFALRKATGADMTRIEVPRAPSLSTLADGAPGPQLPSSDFGGCKLRNGVLKGGGKSVSVQGAEGLWRGVGGGVPRISGRRRAGSGHGRRGALVYGAHTRQWLTRWVKRLQV